MTKYPSLVPKRLCKTSIQIILYQEGLSEDGEPLESLKINTLCNYQDRAKRVLDAEHRIIQIEGTALIPGDIAPRLANISDGEVVVNGITRRIYRGCKNRNPDGTVNYTSLELV